MTNPWLNADHNDRIAEIDKEIVQDIIDSDKYSKLISTVEIPEPWIGSGDADIFILLGSPGLDSRTLNYHDIGPKLKQEDSHEYRLELRELAFENLKNPFNNENDYPFYPFNPVLKKLEKGKGHNTWWTNKFKSLIEDICKNNELEKEVVVKAISRSIFNIELYGYHSIKTETKLLYSNYKLPSVQYQVYLVKKAMSENKLILMPRAVRNWFNLVDGLSTYDKAFFVASNRGVEFNYSTLSPSVYKQVKSIIIKNLPPEY